MSGLRRRRQQGGQKGGGTKGDSPSTVKGPSTPSEDALALAKLVYVMAGLGVLAYSCSWYSSYMQDLHENQLWFSKIGQMEREISLRTECGLYYSYFKQIMEAPSVSQGIYQLTRDNVTEHGRTINILERFNVYQEVLLAAFHRAFHLSVEPILFYVYACFKLTGLFLGAVYLVAWYLTGTWLAGALCAVYFAINLDDATRAFFTVNLRETFAFPFLWFQILLVCIYLERSAKRSRFLNPLLCVGIVIQTFLFSLMWQFNQFVLLIQAVSLYGIALLQLTTARKVQTLLFLQAIGLIGVWAVQFAQPMVLGSLVLSFIPAAICTLHVFQRTKLSGGVVLGSFKIVLQGLLTVALTLALNKAVAWLLRLEADEHIFKFLKGKFGLSDPTDFEARIYLCHGAFVFLDNGFFWRTSSTFLFPPYMIVLCGTLFIIGKDLLTEWCVTTVPTTNETPHFSDKPNFFCRRANLAYLVVQSCVSGVIGMMTLRMKYLWFPHLAILAAVGFTDLVNLWVLFH